jgi:8-oxo-dGTP pyrophosphatase MutT (NUDIX family)
MSVLRPEPKQPRPANARKVFDGKIFDVYQWDQKLFNGETAVFETLVRPDTTVVIPVRKDGKILVTRQQQPGKESEYWSFPGGRVEKGEEADVSALRELCEETGYVSKDLKLWHSEQPIHKIDWAIYTFIAYNCELSGEVNLDGGEKIKVVPMEIEEVLGLGREGAFGESFAVHAYRAELDPEYKGKLLKLFMNK